MASYTAKSREQNRAPLPLDTARAVDTRWWVEPVAFALLLSAFALYTTYRAFENNYFFYPWTTTDIDIQVHRATLLSPFYSPYIPLKLHIGQFTLSPALYILVFPLAFRMTCYYYRKAYYRAFFHDPPACALTEPNPEGRMRYTGERTILLFQNFHRYAMYAAVVFIVILTYDTIKAFIFTDAAGNSRFGISVGSIVFLVNILLLSAYTFGCHSVRHLIGGGADCYSCTALDRTRYGLWTKVSFLNKRHAFYAWWSMISVGLTDLYVNLVARGVMPDVRIF